MVAGVSATSTSGDKILDKVIAELQSDAYLKASAIEKRERLWDAVSARPYETLPPVNLSNFRSFYNLLRLSWLRKAFDTEADVRPPREKAFHPFGTVAKVKFVADGQHDFTGLFKSGAVGLARLSLALSEKAYAPSAAFKFLIDGKLSRNVLLDQSIDKQTSRDFFERSPTNVTLWPKLFPKSFIWFVIDAWLSNIAPVMHQPLEHIASVASDGQEVAEVNAPYQIYLTAPGEVHFNPNATEDFRVLLSRIPSGAVLYRVFASRIEGSSEMIYIGYIETESGFVASEFGDRVLSLRHFRQEPARSS